ncbi:S-adenosyl-L-methionine-dependent methyltransferase [Aspergillus parasiticus]|uniref:S-adenosyl-L-methionine-dependent methyltransferase n=2 Tax=Aspergillus subgen. Circumdati TaxID=2720871 RepID=A0A5N6DTR7_ASPPA|nr:S-adenosyl-L-methionine-dependent methyltransferase [Aspergillus parasiticus]KAE8313654.1 S-adenosyl-L-methionine-dependent methyltransferase [Aspergillus transmontanensis]
MAEQPTAGNTTSTPPKLSVLRPEDNLPLLEVAEEEDEEDFSATDSALGSTGSQSYATSLLSEVRNYKYENGRRYHSYREGQCVLPNDEQEQDREDLLHHVRNLHFSGDLFHAPIPEDVENVFDIGTGTGIWAIDFADTHPNARVIGTDLSPIQPAWVPPNLEFFVDDVEADWTFKRDYFDFIRACDLAGSIADWPKLLRQAYSHMKPGGWLELSDFEMEHFSDDDTLDLAPSLGEWFRLLIEASARFNRPMKVATDHQRNMIDAGFTDVKEKIYKFPMGPWAKEKRLKEAGRFHREVMVMSLESYALALCTRVLGWSPVEVAVFLASVRKELRDPRVHIYGKFHVVWGRRPTE